MKLRNLGVDNLSQKILNLNKKSLAKEQVVSLSAYRAVIQKHKQKTICIVDENFVSLNGLKRLCEAQGFKVVAAQNAMEVSKILADVTPDIMLVDVEIPWVNGFELCGLLKSSAVFSHMPVALISTKKDEETLEKGQQAGCDDYITKPCNAQELKEKLLTLLVN